MSNLNLFDQPDMDLFDSAPPEPIPAAPAAPLPVVVQIPDGKGAAPAAVSPTAAILGAWGIPEAWALYVADRPSANFTRNEATARDIVDKLVRYGSISPASESYLKSIISQLAVEANAADCPEGRMVVEGRVLTIKDKDTQYGTVLKMLIQAPAGFKVWGTCPVSLDCRRGDVVRFTATVERSKDDSKFGFAARPTKAVVLQRAEEGTAQ